MGLNSEKRSVNKDGVMLHCGKTEKTKEFTYKFFISVDGASEVPLESLTADELTAVKKKLRGNLERNMSEYYSLHPEEYSAV